MTKKIQLTTHTDLGAPTYHVEKPWAHLAKAYPGDAVEYYLGGPGPFSLEVALRMIGAPKSYPPKSVCIIPHYCGINKNDTIVFYVVHEDRELIVSPEITVKRTKTIGLFPRLGLVNSLKGCIYGNTEREKLAVCDGWENSQEMFLHFLSRDLTGKFKIIKF